MSSSSSSELALSDDDSSPSPASKTLQRAAAHTVGSAGASLLSELAPHAEERQSPSPPASLSPRALSSSSPGDEGSSRASPSSPERTPPPPLLLPGGSGAPAAPQSALQTASAPDAELSAEEYLARHHIGFYLRDAVAQLLEEMPERPLESAARYFRGARRGDHVCGRDFAFVNAAPHNRMAFVRQFRGRFARLESSPSGGGGGGGEADDADTESWHPNQSRPPMEASFADYLQLLRLICEDFPATYTEDCAKCLTATGALTNTLRFSEFCALFQVLFFFAEFMVLSGEAYRRCMSQEPTGLVFSAPFLDEVTSSIYDSDRAVSPRLELLQAMFEQMERSSKHTGRGIAMTFNDFCVALSRNEAIAAHFGAGGDIAIPPGSAIPASPPPALRSPRVSALRAQELQEEAEAPAPAEAKRRPKAKVKAKAKRRPKVAVI